MNSPLPSPLVEKFGHLSHIKQRTAVEWSSECPVCSTSGHYGNDIPDRFRMFNDDKPLGWCRRCGHVEFANDSTDHKPDLARILELEKIRQREAAKEEARLQDKIKELQRRAYWQGFHDAMGNDHRQLWRNAGIPDEFQDYWQLGYQPEYKGFDFTSPAITIPYFSNGWQAQTIQYRLMNPPTPSDKYRFQAGLKSALWMADPDNEPQNAVILCEGMKKAAVTFIEVVARENGRYSVVSVPSKMPGKELLNGLANADPLYICLDPDAYEGKRPAVNRLIKMLGNIPKRLVKLPVKADDFFTVYNGNAFDFMNYLDIARPI